jgi:hypothetical protein
MFHPFMVMGITLFNVFQKTLYQFASRGKNGQTNHDEKYPLKDRKEKAEDSQPDKNPAKDQNSHLLEFVHSTDLLNRFSVMG